MIVAIIPGQLSYYLSTDLPLESVMSKFIDYQQALTTFPLDISDFISLIEKIRVETETPTFSTYISLLQNLNLDMKAFFGKYLPHLPNWMTKTKKYRNEQIADLLRHVSQWEELFGNYLCSCASNVTAESFWKVFLKLITNLNFSDTMLTQMSSVLIKQSNSIHIQKFIDIINPVIDTQTTLNDENFSNLMKILGTVFDKGEQTDFLIS